MSMLLWVAVLVGSLAVLVRAAGAFVRSAEAIGLHFGLSPFILGVTVVALGTSVPELVSGVTSVLHGAPEIAVGTAVGSNITNILLVLGVAALLGNGLRVDYELVRVDLPFLFGSALMLWFFGFDSSIGVLEGLVGIVGLVAYLLYAASTPEEPGTTVARSAADMAPATTATRSPVPARVWLLLIGSAALTQLGAYCTIESAIQISAHFEVGNEVIATTVLALGTSLPELVVSARAAREGKPEIAVGNVIGSNIFNALGVVGVSALFGTLAVPASLAEFALPAMVGVTLFGFLVLQEREVTRWDAWLFLVLYVAFLLPVLGLG